jgi:hypothetical protein
MKKGFQKGNRFGTTNRGKTRSEESKKKLSEARKGKHLSPKTEFKKGAPAYNKGKTNPLAKNLPQLFKKGQKPHNYKGGVSPFRALVRSSIEYKQWRLQVFMRDGFKCVLCFKKGHLNADHFPKMFSTIMNENGIKTMPEALDCAELWDIKNGRTLCKSCHYKITWK